MPERLNRLADHCVEAWNTSKEAQEISLKTKFKFTRDEVLKKIYSLRVLNLAELISSVYKTKKFIESKGIYNNVSLIELESNNITNAIVMLYFHQVRLIVVDCFASFLLDETPTDRIAFMYEMLHILGEIAKKQNCAVVVTNNMTTVITTDMSLTSLFQTQALKPALGDAFHYRIQQRILLSKSEYDSQVVIAHVQKNVVDGPSLLKFKITQNGIEDVWYSRINILTMGMISFFNDSLMTFNKFLKFFLSLNNTAKS